jgi:hypothetical protein
MRCGGRAMHESAWGGVERSVNSRSKRSGR